MNNIKFLLLGTSLSFIPTLSFSQCVATQDCATLGYTETSCSGSKGIKCPFGNKWACFKTDSEIKNQLCTELGFTYSCTGTNQTGGASKACNGKYNACSCSEGYEWKNGACTDTIAAVSCTVGTLYYSDGKCHDQKVSYKPLLGVVIMEKTTTASGWIMTIDPIKKPIGWGGHGDDIPGLGNCASTSCLSDVQASCTNTDVITNYGNSSKYPAAWAAKNYKPSGTPSGKSWCLPSGGLLNNALNNSTNLTKINIGIHTGGGIGIGEVYGNNEYVWSSSEYDYRYAWSFRADAYGSFSVESPSKYGYYDYSSVRPVLPF